MLVFMKTAQSIQISDRVEDIIAINQRSAQTTDRIRIMELSSLGQVIPLEVAESIRASLLARQIKVYQLTNQRAFEPWTKVSGFVETCMNVRSVSADLLPIQTEVLLFDDIVAIYRVEPEVSVMIIEEPAFAAQQKALFDNFWNIATPTALNQDGSTTLAVTIKCSPAEVYRYISNLSNWPQFSEFAAQFERVTDQEYIAHTPQGDIRVVAQFDPERMLLDTHCILPGGDVQLIPYRVVPNKDGAELLMTNFRSVESTREEYDEQLRWMEIELKKAKEILEAKKD